MTKLDQSRRHKFVCEQVVEVKSDSDYPPLVQIVVLCRGHCAEHHAPIYGCVHGGDSFSFCEESIKPLSRTHKENMN
jgi:hypothetical protein